MNLMERLKNRDQARAKKYDDMTGKPGAGMAILTAAADNMLPASTALRLAHGHFVKTGEALTPDQAMRLLSPHLRHHLSGPPVSPQAAAPAPVLARHAQAAPASRPAPQPARPKSHLQTVNELLAAGRADPAKLAEAHDYFYAHRPAILAEEKALGVTESPQPPPGSKLAILRSMLDAGRLNQSKLKEAHQFYMENRREILADEKALSDAVKRLAAGK